jgi:hypothetical protein
MLKIRSETENIFTSRIAFFLKVFLGVGTGDSGSLRVL